MKVTAITTIQDLQTALTNYANELPIVMLDNEKGYVSVAFKKESAQKEGKTAQWLTFYPHPEKSVYPIKTLLDYLNRLPEKAPIATKGQDGRYSPLFLAIDTMEDKGKTCQWLVINDRLTYQETFLALQNRQQQQALDKMLVEMNKEHAPAIEPIHNWLCQQQEEALFLGILKNDRTLKGAMTYCQSKAKEQAENATCAMVDDKTVFQWVRDYFLLEKVEAPKVSGTVAVSQKTKPTTATNKECEVDGQVSLFELT